MPPPGYENEKDKDKEPDMAQIAAITAAEMPWEVEFEFPLPLPLPFVPFPPPFGSTPPVDPGIIAVDPSVGMNVRIAEPPIVPVAPGRTTLFEKVVTTPFASVETPAKMTPISVSMPSLNDDIPETVASVEAASPESEPDCEAGELRCHRFLLPLCQSAFQLKSLHSRSY